MTDVPFRAGGPLSSDSPVYVERKADGEALQHLQQMHYVQLTEPRQQGKTSLIYRLHNNLRNSVYKLAYVDAESLSGKNEAAWYRDLAVRLVGQLRTYIKCDGLAIPVDASTWRAFLSGLVTSEPHPFNYQPRLIIAIDEVGSVPAAWAEDFFRVLREIYTVREFEADFRRLTFVLAGAFDPRDLIQDVNISPFNVAQRVSIEDFDLTQVKDLVSRLALIADQQDSIADRLYDWTDGQPYLTQKLCLYLAEYGSDITPESVDTAVDRFFQDDVNHLPRIAKDLEADSELLDCARRGSAGGVRFSPAVNPLHFRLAHVTGVIKPDANGFCQIRNRIYERAFPHLGKSAHLYNQNGPVSSSPLNSLPEKCTAMRHPELKEALQRHTLTFFIGADLPREVTGLPSRADLARELARRKGLDETLSLAEVAQRVSQAGNRWEFTDFIRSALDTVGKSPQPFHWRIVELVRTHHIETLITTAYDNLLELAFQEAGVGINRVVHFINPDRPTLIKLYGDAQQPDTLVVTDRDHSALLRDRDREDLVDEVKRAFRRSTVLFLGYNLNDPDFRFLFDQIAESRFARTACAVWPGLPEADVRMWRDRGIVILDVDPLGILGKFEAPSAPGGRPELAIALPALELSIGGKDMDYERGLDVLKQFAEGSDWYDDFDLYEAQLGENLRDERRYGPSEQSRRDRARIVDHLNALAREHLDISFNDLCMGKLPRVERLDKAAGEDITALIQELKALVIEANAADREASERLWQAVQQGRVEQGEKGDGEAPATTEIYGTGKRWAVLIGVNEYVDKANYGRLHVCVKDVHAIREQFIAGGFEPARIRLLADGTSELPTRDNILVALKAVADATEADDLLLFYYSGHGDEDEGESYLVARNGRRLVLSDTAVRVSRVKEIMEQAPARAKVIVLDACHSGADIGGKGPKPMSSEFIRRVFEQAEGLAILASCKQGQVSYEWRAQERSVFTHFLLEALEGQADRDEKDFVTVQDTNRHVTNGVKLWASQHNVSQTPTLQTAVAGDIILVRHQ